MFVSVYSNIDTPPASAVYALKFCEDGTIQPLRIGALIQSTSKFEKGSTFIMSQNFSQWPILHQI